MNATIVDVETTGLDREKDLVIEIAALTFDPEEGIISSVFSTLINREGVTPSDEITSITGITKDMLSYGMKPESAWTAVGNILDKSDCIIAHNAEFDLSFIRRSVPVKAPSIDTMTALPLPKACMSRSLEGMCKFHRIRNYQAHRAVFDVVSLYQLVMLYNWETILERAKSPQVEIVATLSYNEMMATPEERRPNKFGFKWNPERKVWALKVLKVDLEQTNYPFETIIQSGAI